MKKNMYIVIISILVLLALATFSKKSVHNEIVINASSHEVWDVLMNTDDYYQWNPTMEVLEGSVVEGSKVKYRFTQEENSTYEISAKVEKVEKHKLLNQKGGMLLILTFNHKYILQHEKEKTRVTIHEDYRGLGVLFWNPKQVEQAYTRLNHALKKRVESFN